LSTGWQLIAFADRQASVLPFCNAYYMSDALYGLLGALGGALISAAAAYWGPIQAQRRANAAAAEQARVARETEAAARAEELARAEVQREYDKQVARHRERERQRDFAAENQRRADKDERHSAIERVIRIRTTNRAWCQTLGRYLEDLTAGRIIRVEDFDKEVRHDRDDAQSAIDMTMHDGFMVRQTDRSPALPPQETLGFKASHSAIALNQASAALRAAILASQPLLADRLAELDRVVTEAEAARSALTSMLWDYVERLGSGVSYHDS
jgi:hypothetical protein